MGMRDDDAFLQIAFFKAALDFMSIGQKSVLSSMADPFL